SWGQTCGFPWENHRDYGIACVKNYFGAGSVISEGCVSAAFVGVALQSNFSWDAALYCVAQGFVAGCSPPSIEAISEPVFVLGAARSFAAGALATFCSPGRTVVTRGETTFAVCWPSFPAN